MFGPRESWRAERMAAAMGVSLAPQVLGGFLTRDDLARFAARCRACAEGAICGREPKAARGHCGNRADLEGLA